MADTDETAGSHHDEPQDEPNASSALRQRLLTVDEVYVYKIPPLKNAGGHRAEDWNLASPLQTCQLIVERRGDALVLEFTVSGSLFCQSVIDLSPGPATASSSSGNSVPALTMEQMVEAAVDTSRYFVTRIQGRKAEGAGAGGTNSKKNQPTALIGFGFRERDTAVDFRESLQFYQRAMQREQQADQSSHRGAAAYSIPKLGDDEKIHVNMGGGAGGSKKKKVSTTITKSSTSGCPSSPGATGSVPLLLKKPPPPFAMVQATDASPSAVDGAQQSASTTSQEAAEQLSSSLRRATLDGPEEPNRASDAADGADDESDWAEFQSAA